MSLGYLRQAAGVPRRRISQLRTRLRRAWEDARLTLTSRHAVISSLYYGLVNRSLSREAMAVAAGQLHYRKEQAVKRGFNYYLLRRNIHRLEKGLVMRPRRPIFGLDFIDETIATWARVVADEAESSQPEVLWATDVLNAYFAAVDGADPRIARARKHYEVALAAHITAGPAETQVPYARDLGRPLQISIDDMLELARHRRSVRWYEDRPVPRAVVDQALQVAVQAPSACNRQPFVYRIFDEPAQAQEIAALAMGTKGFADELQAIVVLVGQLRAYPHERDRHAIYIDASLSAMSFMFALETLGVASCSINWPDHEPHESLIRERLKLAPDERVVMLLAYGWPDPLGLVPCSTKRSIDRVRSFN
jgi:nitroreductase